ncbi:aldehyde dehydrogenase family protein [Georgenia sp. SYP-B2076]|uniref:aldehyde dehydrogenase family protein n=1 Tax=Georgenia sp. SYP-B2076 TaxID=2495881 RepID=UPI00210130C9|nr:aldehyde dehydrogenase family protein [Georgenia sp. SYP-B2076]
MAVRERDWTFLIGGALRSAEDGRTFPVIDPYTVGLLADVPDASPSDADAAVDAARAALPAWRKVPVLERAKHLYRLADIVEANAEELAFLEMVDTGSPISNARADVTLAVQQIRMYANLALELKGQTIPASSGLHYSIRQPEGVVVKISAFNHPLMFGCRFAAPVLAGNTVVVKPSELAPLSMLRLGELIVDEFPPGVVNIVVGAGASVPDRLVRHPAVRRISFIGSESTGRAIQRAAAESGVKHVTLELGGKNAMVVFEDVDVDEAALGAVKGMNFTWSGQSCGSNSRVLAHSSIVEELTDKIVDLVRARKIGDPMDEATEQGTMIDRGQYEKSLEYIEIAKQEGARVVVGGGRPEGPGFDDRFFVEATVLTDVRPEFRIAQEEVFGPIMSVIPFDTEDEAIRIANGVDYGLTASVWTKDLNRALRVVEEFEAGYIWVNHSSTHFPGTPYGGVKRSGVGAKEECLEELLSYTEEKVVNVVY